MRLLALAALNAARLALAAMPVTDIFVVDTRTCGPYLANQNGGPSILQQITNEAGAMAVEGLNVLNSAGSTGPGGNAARAELQGFFKASVANPEAMDIHNFLINGIQPPHNNGRKPRLYCDDTYFLRRSPRNQAVQLNGDPAVDPEGNPVSVGSLYAQDITAVRFGGVEPSIFLVELQAGGAGDPGGYQYYFFPNQDPFRVCGGAGNLGETFVSFPNSPVPAIVLCPRSFTYGATATLGNINPAPPAQAGVVGQTIDDIKPVSSTFLHELYHFCPWAAVDVVDVEDRPYNFVACVQRPIGDAVVNAENYALYALSAWYYVHKQTAQGLYVSYSTGSCQLATP